MMGFEFDVPCDCCELVLEVVEWSYAALNASFSCEEEAASAFVGAGGTLLAVVVGGGTLMSCCLSKPVSVTAALVVPLARWPIADRKDVMKITSMERIRSTAV
jgi:hypothetical protein